MKWKRTLAGLGLAGCLLLCGCLKTVTGKYDSFRADQLYDQNQKQHAFELYQQSARKGVAGAQYMISQMLLYSDGIHANTAEGLEWLQKAAQQDHIEASRDLGLYLLNGDFGLHRDTQQGIAWLERAAAGGDTLSMMTLGHLYFTGYGVSRNARTAASWFVQASQYGETIPAEWQDADRLASTRTIRPYNAKTEYRQRVKRAQAALKALGYYRSAVDGLAGPGTAAAVKNFQKDQQVEVNGRIDVALMRQLYRRIVFDPMKRQL